MSAPDVDFVKKMFNFSNSSYPVNIFKIPAFYRNQPTIYQLIIKSVLI